MGSLTFADTSALVAILLNEHDAQALSAKIEMAAYAITSSAVRLETCMVVSTRRDVPPLRAESYFDDLISDAGLTEMPIDESIGRLAVACFERFGKGRHRAQLNFGDCLSYACARATGAFLLFKGADFAKTDANSWIER